MKKRGVLGLAAGTLLLLSGLAHAFLGWPMFDSALRAANVDARLVSGLAAGWYFGSVAMLAFGVIVTHAGVCALRGRRPAAVAVAVIAIACVLFGLTAFCALDWNKHFLGFVLIGAMAGTFALWRSE